MVLTLARLRRLAGGSHLPRRGRAGPLSALPANVNHAQLSPRQDQVDRRLADVVGPQPHGPRPCAARRLGDRRPISCDSPTSQFRYGEIGPSGVQARRASASSRYRDTAVAVLRPPLGGTPAGCGRSSCRVRAAWLVCVSGLRSLAAFGRVGHMPNGMSRMAVSNSATWKTWTRSRLPAMEVRGRPGRCRAPSRNGPGAFQSWVRPGAVAARLPLM